MTDTSLRTALELTIQEFNQWAADKPLWSKMSFPELKGVFTEKMKRNMKATDSRVTSSLFTPAILEYFLVENDRIRYMMFDPKSVHLSYEKAFLADCNSELAKISFSMIGGGLGQGFITSLNSTIQSINHFKITV